MNIWFVIGGGIAIYYSYNFVKDMMIRKRENAAKNKPTNVLTVFKETAAENFTAEERVPSDLSELSGKSLGGQPIFYNLADHRRGRFLGWTRHEIDKADDRVVHNNLYRARISVDVKYWWFVVGTKEIITPCVFRPKIDSKFVAPGEEVGVPPEGVMMFYRSFTGTQIAKSNSERLRVQLLDEQHKQKIMADVIANMRDKERLRGAREASKELVDEMEARMKQAKRVTGASSSSSSGFDNFGVGNPYGPEVFSDDKNQQPEQNQQDSSSWNFEG